MKTLSEILAFLKYPCQHIEEKSIRAIYQDHRKCRENDIFIALSGKHHDGHHYIAKAEAKGVSLIIAEDLTRLPQRHPTNNVVEITNIREKLSELANWFYDAPSTKCPLFAVTGTNGKTSVSHFIAQILSAFSQTGVLGTVGNGIYPTLIESTHTTLDNLSLQALLNRYIHEGARNIVIEASSHALAQKRLDKIAIDTAIFTNLDTDHLDYHGSMQAYFKAKISLFNMSGLQRGVINIDNEYGKTLYQKLQKHTALPSCLSYSVKDKNADCCFEMLMLKSTGIKVNIYWQKQFITCMYLPIIGRFNVSNIAASFAAVVASGYPIHQVLKALKTLKNVEGRLEHLSFARQPLVVIDYAHTPDALENVLRAVKAQTTGKLICVFGCGGDRMHDKRAKMGEIAEKYADFSIVTEDNNRYENFAHIKADIVRGFKAESKRYTVIPNREKAISHALTYANEQDVILLAGKGHERYLEKNGKRHFFDERAIVKKAFDHNQP